MKKLFAIILCLCMALTLLPLNAGAVPLSENGVATLQAGGGSMENFEALPRTAYSLGQFSDVDETAWYGAYSGAYIQTAYELSIVNGKGGGVFDPTGSVLLSEAIKMAAVVRSVYNGGDGVMSAESGEAWYAPYVNYCVAEGVISASDFGGSFSRAATRAEMAYIFANALPDSELLAINTVTDIPDVSSSTPYCDEIFKMYRAGALQGSDAYGTFSPDSAISRAETTAIITRIALPSRRLSFSLETPPKVTESAYTPYMTIPDMETLEQAYIDCVWGLNNEMYAYATYDLVKEFFDGDYTQQWVPHAVDVKMRYDSRLLVCTFSNRGIDFEMDAILRNEAVAPLATTEARSYMSEIKSILSAIITPGMTERQRLLTIHDWLIANASYDLDLNEDSFHSYGILKNGEAVCQGYAELFYYMANLTGVECRTVVGQGYGSGGWESHMWNCVLLTGDDTIYYIDVTFDDPIPDTTYGRTDYFMVSAQKMSRDHKW